MRATAEYLKAERFDTIYASTRVRTLESARILAASHPCGYQEEPGLREIDFGDFEGLTYDEIAARYPEVYRQWMESPTTVQFPNGESFAAMRARVLRTFEAINQSHAGRTVAIVTHGGVIRIILAWALGVPDANLFRMAQDYAAMNLLTLVEGIPMVKAMNVTSGLIGR